MNKQQQKCNKFLTNGIQENNDIVGFLTPPNLSLSLSLKLILKFVSFDA